MKPQIVKTLSIILFGCMAVAGCTKEKAPGQNPPPDPLPVQMDPDVAALFDDNSTITDQLHELSLIAVKVIESCAVMSGETAVPYDVCGATTFIDNGTHYNSARIHFTGGDCQGKYRREGDMIINGFAGDEWKNRRTGLMISFDDLKVTRKSDNKLLTFNGDLSFTNSSGGLLHPLAGNDTIGLYLSSNDLRITFTPTNDKVWSVSHSILLRKDNGVVIRGTGLENIGGNNHVSMWGTDRRNRDFRLGTPSPIVMKESCDYRITEGELAYSSSSVNTTIRFGLNAEGNTSQCPGSGSYYCNVNWQLAGSDSALATLLPY